MQEAIKLLEDELKEMIRATMEEGKVEEAQNYLYELMDGVGRILIGMNVLGECMDTVKIYSELNEKYHEKLKNFSYKKLIGLED